MISSALYGQELNSSSKGIASFFKNSLGSKNTQIDFLIKHLSSWKKEDIEALKEGQRHCLWKNLGIIHEKLVCLERSLEDARESMYRFESDLFLKQINELGLQGEKEVDSLEDCYKLLFHNSKRESYATWLEILENYPSLVEWKNFVCLLQHAVALRNLLSDCSKRPKALVKSEPWQAIPVRGFNSFP